MARIGFRDEAAAAPASNASTDTLLGPAGDGGAAPASSAPADAAGGDTPPWYSVLPEELHQDPNLTKYTSLEAMARGHIEQSALVGRKADALPDPANTEALAEFMRSKLGAPATAADYKLTAPEGVAEGLSPEGPLAEAFLAAAHQHGVLPSQAQGLYAGFVSAISEAMASEDKALDDDNQAELAKLTSEWGDRFDQNRAAARYAAEKTGIQERLRELGLENDVPLARALAKFGASIAQDVVRDNGSFTNTSTTEMLAAAEAKARDAAMEMDPRKSRQLSAEADELYRRAYEQ